MQMLANEWPLCDIFIHSFLCVCGFTSGEPVGDKVKEEPLKQVVRIWKPECGRSDISPP